MNTQQRHHFFTALAMIGFTVLGIGSTATIGQWGQVFLDPTSGSGAQVSGTGSTIAEMDFGLSIESHLAQQYGILLGTGGTILPESGTGGIMNLLQDAYRQSPLALAGGLMQLPNPVGAWNTMQETLHEYVLSEVIARQYRQELLSSAGDRALYPSLALDYGTVAELQEADPIIQREDPERLRTRRQNNTQILYTTGSGSTVYLQGTQWKLPPYSTVGEEDVLHASLRALGEVRSILELPRDQVALYLSPETAMGDTTTYSIAPVHYTKTPNGWNTTNQLYYQGKSVRNATIQATIGTNAELQWVQSSIPPIHTIAAPLSKEVYFNDIPAKLSEYFPDFQGSTDTIHALQDMYVLEETQLIPAIAVDVQLAKPFGRWHVLVNAHDGTFITRYNTYQFGEEGMIIEEGMITENNGVPHRSHALYLFNSPTDPVLYAPQRYQPIELLPSQEIIQGDSEGIFYPNERQSRITLHSPWHRVYSGSQGNASAAFRDYLELTGSGAIMDFSTGSGSQLLSQLWEQEESMETGIVHPYYWTAEEASLDEMNVSIHITAYAEYVATVLNRAIPANQPIIVRSDLLQQGLQGCGALFDPQTETIHFGAGGCQEYSYAFSRDMIIHEYTHALLHSIYQPLYTEANFDQSLMEGVADYMAASFSNDSIIGEGVLTQPRDLSNDLQFISSNEEGIITGTDWSHHIYHNGTMIGGLFWDIRESLGPIITDSLVYNAMSYQPHTPEELLIALLRADSPTGTLLTPGIHWAVIQEAAAHRGIIDNMLESDLQYGPMAEWQPLAPTLRIVNAAGESDYQHLLIQEGSAIEVSFTDPREEVSAAMISLSWSKHTTPNGAPTIWDYPLDTPLNTGETTTLPLPEFPEHTGYIRVQLQDTEGNLGTWSTPLFLRSPYLVKEEVPLHLLQHTPQGLYTHGEEVAVRTGTGVTIMDSAHPGNHSFIPLDFDMEEVAGHMISNNYVLLYDEGYYTLLLIDRTKDTRYLFALGSTFIKENDLWRSTELLPELPEALQGVALVEEGNSTMLYLSTAQSLHRYTLETQSVQTLYTNPNWTIHGMTVLDTNTIAVQVMEGEHKHVVIFNTTHTESSITPSYSYCGENTCMAPPAFQQLLPLEAAQLYSMNTAHNVAYGDSTTLQVLHNPYGEGGSSPYTIQFGGENTEYSLSSTGSTILGNAHTATHGLLTTGSELMLMDHGQGKVVYYESMTPETSGAVALVHEELWYVLHGETLYTYSATGLDFNVPLPALPNEEEEETTPVEPVTEEEGGITQEEEESTETGEETLPEASTEPTTNDIPEPTEEELLEAMEANMPEQMTLGYDWADGALRLTWEDGNELGVQSYHVYRAHNQPVSSTTNLLAELTGDARSFDDSVTMETGLYRYRVYGVDGSGTLLYKSNDITIQTSSVPPAPAVVLPQNGSIVMPRPVVQFQSIFGKETGSFYQVQLATDAEFNNLLIEYLSTSSTRDTYAYRVGQEQGMGMYTMGADITTLEPGVYFSRGRLVGISGVEGLWSTPHLMIVDDMTMNVETLTTIDFNNVGQGESIISSGSTIISAQTYVPSFSFKVFNQAPELLEQSGRTALIPWNGTEGFGFTFRWSSDGGQNWNYRKGDSQVEWERIPENLTYYPLGSVDAPTVLNLHTGLNTLERKNFLVELKYRLTNPEGDLGTYRANVIVAPSGEMYGEF